MKKILIIIIVLFSGYGITAQDLSKIDVNLQHEMMKKKLLSSTPPPSEGDGGRLIRINIILNAQYDQIELRNRANTLRSKEAKRNFVVNELKYFSQETQKGVISFLSTFSTSPSFGGGWGEAVTEIQSFWISNSINCYASIDVIEALSYHPDVLLIGWDNEQHLISPPTPQRGDLESEINDNESFIRNDSPLSCGEGTGERSREITYNVLKVQANLVWELGYTGEGVVVSVIDSGVNYNHADLQGNMWEHPDYPYHGYNYMHNNNNPLDDNGHGTHCAGTVAGKGTSGSQTGMAPNAKIMALKVLDSEGYGNLSGIINAIQFSVENGAHIISMSLGFAGGGTNSERIQFRNTMNNALEAGIIASVAAGNEGSGFGPAWFPVPNNIRVPGNCPPPWTHPDQTLKGGNSAVVCVGATNSNDHIAPFSSKGPVTWQTVTGFNDYLYNPGMGLIRPDVVAPGVNIKSLRHNSNTGYVNMDGTSMATPCVAGIMALMLSKNPTYSPADICEILQTTALPLSATKNNTFGAGRVNALDAVNAGAPIHISFESFEINDENGNNNGLLNPGEEVFLTISLKNDDERVVENANVVLVTNNELVTINQDNADFGLFSELETVTVQNAFSITLSPEAQAFQEIAFKLIVTSGESVCETTFKIIVNNYLFEILQVVIPKEDPLTAGETTDVWFYLKNTGNDFSNGVTGKLSTTSMFLTINENEQFYGPFESEQYKYRPFNVTVSPNAPPSLSRINVTFSITDEYDRITQISSQINFKNSDILPQICTPIDTLMIEKELSNLILTWAEPEESAPQKYFIYCNNSFLTETTATSYTHEDVEPGIYIYCIEALYEDGCTSGLYCQEFLFPCSVSIDLQATQISETEILLIWDTDLDVEDLTFKVYRNSEFLTVITDNSYTDADLETGIEYCYIITVMCNETTESESSNEDCLTLTGIERMQNHGVILYPNPFTNEIIVSGEYAVVSIQIVNAMGQIVKDIKYDGKPINTANLNCGVYFVVIEGFNGEKIVNKMVK